MILLLLLGACEDGCTARERCEKRGGHYVTTNCREVSNTYFMDMGNGMLMPMTSTSTECDEWCEK